MSSPNSHSQVSKLQNTNADHVTLGSILNKNKRVFCTYVTWGFNKKKRIPQGVFFQQEWGQSSLTPTTSDSITCEASKGGQQPVSGVLQHVLHSGHSKGVQVLELGVQWDKNWRGELCPPLKSGHVMALPAQWYIHSSPRWSSPHLPHELMARSTRPSATALMKEHIHFNRRKFWPPSSKEQPVPWRSNHLNIGAHTFQFGLQEGHFMYPASNSHTGCVANTIILETKWHRMITNFF